MPANLKYPWQQAVADALMEMQSDRVPQRIAAAEEAIAARLCEGPDSIEQRALRNALAALKTLRLSPDKAD